MAEFMMIICGDEATRDQRPQAEVEATMAKIGQWWQQHTAAGRITGGHRLQPADTAKTVHLENGSDAFVTDGPFVESKEVVGGYGILNVPDIQAAVDLAKTWPGPGMKIEVRPIMDM
jgi:hypothetical protein